MKILFVNPPVIRFGTDSPEHDQRLLSPLFRTKLRFHRYSAVYHLLDRLDVGKGARSAFVPDLGGHDNECTTWWTSVSIYYGYAAGLLKSNGLSGYH